MDEQERARAAEERRMALAAHGLPEATRYGWLTMRGTDAGTVRYELAEVFPDGRVEVFLDWTGQAQADWPIPYVLTIYGVLGPLPAYIRRFPELADSERVFHRVHFGPAPAGGGEVIESADTEASALPLWTLRGTARYGSSPVYAETRPRPEGGWRDGLGGLHLRHTKRDRDLAYKGLPHLRAAREGKRLTTPPAEEFLQKAQEAAALLRRYNRTLTREHVVAQLPWEKSRCAEILATYRAQGVAWAASWKTLLLRLHRGFLADDGDNERTFPDVSGRPRT